MAKKGCIVSELTRKKISRTLKKKYESGELKTSDGLRKKRSEKMFGNNNPMKNQVTREKHKIICNKLERRKHISEVNRKWKRIFTSEWRKNLRLATAKRILRDNQTRSIGKHEKQILDKVANEIGYTILRQYQVCGYFVDGYIPEINVVYEIDESHHFDLDGNILQKDKQRQEEIENELNCKFVRIKDKEDEHK